MVPGEMTAGGGDLILESVMVGSPSSLGFLQSWDLRMEAGRGRGSIDMGGGKIASLFLPTSN